MKFGLYKTENIVVNEPPEKIAIFRMVLFLLEASLFGALVPDSIGMIALAIFIWPLAIFVLFLAFLATAVSLPFLLLAGIPISLFLYKRRISNPLVWMASFFIFSWFYIVLLLLIGGVFGHFNGIMGLPFHSALTGLFMWCKLFDYRFRRRGSD